MLSRACFAMGIGFCGACAGAEHDRDDCGEPEDPERGDEESPRFVEGLGEAGVDEDAVGPVAREERGGAGWFQPQHRALRDTEIQERDDECDQYSRDASKEESEAHPQQCVDGSDQ